MINNRTTQTNSPTEILNLTVEKDAINHIQDIRHSDPFRSDCLEDEMGTFAAHAIDVIDRHVGFDADLDQMLTALEQHADGKMRWMRVIGHREELIVFRDLSMIAFRGRLQIDDDSSLSAEELRDLRDEEALMLGRELNFMEDEIFQGLLPIAFMLDYGSKQQSPSNVTLKAIVDKSKAGGESLKIICRFDGKETEFAGLLLLADLEDPLHGIFDCVEEVIEAARVEATDLPKFRRPAEEDMAEIEAWMFETEGLWVKGDQAFYWPPYLSRPVTVANHPQDVCDDLAALAELAIWACPDLPDEMSITLLSSRTSDEPPTFAYELPRHIKGWGGARYAANNALAALHQSFNNLFELCGNPGVAPADYPIGHRTGIKTPTTPGASGLPIATIKATRPNARRALEIAEEYPHGFDKLLGYVDPHKAAVREEMLLSTPDPLGFPLGEHEGEPFLYKVKGEDGNPDPEHPTISMAIAGGSNPELMARLVSRSVSSNKDEDEMSGYEAVPYNDGCAFSYSIVVGAEHDIHLRRPEGYITVSGILDTKPGEQLGGQIKGHDITTYSLELHLDFIQSSLTSAPKDRKNLTTAVVCAIGSLFNRMYEQGEAQNRHFEMDITIGRVAHDGIGNTITTNDLALIHQAMKKMRAKILKLDIGEFFSIRDVAFAEEDGLAA